MDRLQILGHQVRVSPGHLKRTVAQNFLEMILTTSNMR
jgi:hypothetical protein